MLEFLFYPSSCRHLPGQDYGKEAAVLSPVDTRNRPESAATSTAALPACPVGPDHLVSQAQFGRKQVLYQRALATWRAPPAQSFIPKPLRQQVSILPSARVSGVCRYCYYDMSGVLRGVPLASLNASSPKRDP